MQTIGIDQNGTHYHDLGKHPRKALLERTGYKHAQKMLIGNGVHIGYVVGPLWITLYCVKAWSKGKA